MMIDKNNKQIYKTPILEVISLTNNDQVICDSFGNDYAGYKKFDYGELFGSNN